MTPHEIYNCAYGKLNNLTPIKADCGRLCDRACCQGDENTGMYLFPFEKVLIKELWFEDCNIKAAGGRDLFVCSGSCNRNYRPLSCRIFPLTPYISEKGKLSVVMDNRAKSICPIAYAGDFNNLDPDFIRAVNQIARFLVKFDHIKRFVYELSRECDEYKSYFAL